MILVEQITAYGAGDFPALVVETAPGTPVADRGAVLDLGNQAVGANLTKTLILRNDGTSDLTGLAAWFQLTTLTIGPDGTLAYADESPPPPRVFYRLGHR